MGNASRTAKRSSAGLPSLIDIGRTLQDSADHLRRHALQLAGSVPTAAPGDEAASEAALVRSIIAGRRLRYDYLGVARGDPVWSMLLELYAARLEGRRVYQTMLAVAAGVPPTTALRLTRALIEEGVFTSEPDPHDKRLLAIALSDDTAYRIRAYLAAALKAAPLVP